MKARVSLNLPNSLKRAVEDFAAKDGASLNQFVALAVADRERRARCGKVLRGVSRAERAIALLEGSPECQATIFGKLCMKSGTIGFLPGAVI